MYILIYVCKYNILVYYFLLVLRVIYCLFVNIVIILTHIHVYTTFILDKQSNLIEFIEYIQFQI